MRSIRISISAFAAAAIMMLFVAFDAPVRAQMEMTVDVDPGVAVYNDSRHELRVYAFDESVDDRVLLGWIGSDELEFYQVPEEARGEYGDYMIAVQQVTPLPQLGVPADPHPLLATPRLSPDADETARVNIDEDMSLSSIIIEM